MAIATWLLSARMSDDQTQLKTKKYLILYNFSSVRYDMLDKTFSGNIIIWGAGWSGAE